MKYDSSLFKTHYSGIVRVCSQLLFLLKKMSKTFIVIKVHVLYNVLLWFYKSREHIVKNNNISSVLLLYREYDDNNDIIGTTHTRYNAMFNAHSLTTTVFVMVVFVRRRRRHQIVLVYIYMSIEYSYYYYTSSGVCAYCIAELLLILKRLWETLV